MVVTTERLVGGANQHAYSRRDQSVLGERSEDPRAAPPLGYVDSHSVNSRARDHSSAASLIEEFLRSHPRGELFVAVGYASVAGIAWLAERTAERPVTLLIGNTQRSHFREMSDSDRDVATRFLQRNDVSLLNWYQKGRDGRPQREAHLKVWAVMAETGRRRSAARGFVAMLVGSGNLTKAGLFHNEEAFALAAGGDLHRLGAQLGRLRANAWTRKDKILEYLAPPTTAAAADRRGCLASFVPTLVLAAVSPVRAAARTLDRSVRRIYA